MSSPSGGTEWRPTRVDSLWNWGLSGVALFCAYKLGGEYAATLLLAIALLIVRAIKYALRVSGHLRN
jgi:hypothetical protein